MDLLFPLANASLWFLAFVTVWCMCHCRCLKGGFLFVHCTLKVSRSKIRQIETVDLQFYSAKWVSISLILWDTSGEDLSFSERDKKKLLLLQMSFQIRPVCS